jgi:ParB-like nuclease domain
MLLTDERRSEQGSTLFPATSSPRNPFPPLDDDTLDALRASIGRFGVIQPVVLDLEGHIRDGHHRHDIAVELGQNFPVTVIAPSPSDDDQQRRAIAAKARAVIDQFDGADHPRSSVYPVELDADLEEVARSLNADRRHLTVEQRRAFVAEQRAKGRSLRAIASATGVSKDTVSRDEQVSQVRHLTPELPVDREPDAPPVIAIIDDDSPGQAGTIGLDGKWYPTRKRKAGESQKPKVLSRKQLQVMAVRISDPEGRRQRCTEYCEAFIEVAGWGEFEQLVAELAETYAKRP